MSRANTIIISLLFVATLLWLYSYTLNRSLVTSGIDLASIQKQIDSLTIQNQLLREQIYKAEALNTIGMEAQQMGYIGVGNSIMYITK